MRVETLRQIKLFETGCWRSRERISLPFLFRSSAREFCRSRHVAPFQRLSGGGRSTARPNHFIAPCPLFVRKAAWSVAPMSSGKNLQRLRLFFLLFRHLAGALPELCRKNLRPDAGLGPQSVWWSWAQQRWISSTVFQTARHSGARRRARCQRCG